ncbi:MAG: hypothetical protein KKA84_12055 [Bacteroidetes bacterium]|nr:hypothetical protein [Bacteroidota bacterium]
MANNWGDRKSFFDVYSPEELKRKSEHETMMAEAARRATAGYLAGSLGSGYKVAYGVDHAVPSKTNLSHKQMYDQLNPPNKYAFDMGLSDMDIESIKRHVGFGRQITHEDIEDFVISEERRGRTFKSRRGARYEGSKDWDRVQDKLYAQTMLTGQIQGEKPFKWIIDDPEPNHDPDKVTLNTNLLKTKQIHLDQNS